MKPIKNTKNRDLGILEIVKFVKIERLKWIRHVIRIDDDRNPKIILQDINEWAKDQEAEENKEKNIAENAKNIGIRNWREIDVDRKE